MKYLLLSIFLIAIGCNSPKKTVKNRSETKVETTVKETKNEKPVETPPKKATENELIIVLKSAKDVANAKAYVTNSGLTWEKMLFAQGDTQIAMIKVPAEKRDFWLKRLQESGEFKSVELNGIATIQNIKSEINNTLVSFRKTPCYGHCAVFSIRVDKDGKLFYNGIKYVLVEGKREFQLTNKEFNTLKEMLGKTTFSSYKNIYNNPRIMDLPSSYITHNNKQIQIRLWKNVPRELSSLTEYIEDLVYNRKYYER